ncbi:MAG: caspase domain-containing protein, partial [Elainella sp.]
ALVVGINTYQYLPSLKAPAQDAEAIAQQLHQYGEFRVHRLPEVIQEGKPQIGRKTSVTLRELETALINLFKPKGSNVPQTAVFYFSGHGIQREAGIQEGYLALSDSNPEQGFYGLSLFWLRRLLQESPVRQRIIWLDCCHSGELLNFLEADPGAHPGTDRLFMAASRE